MPAVRAGRWKSVAVRAISNPLRRMWYPRDILPAAWLDSVCDAHSLPFADACFDNIVMFDVLHHLQRPALFFAEASRVLRPGGRVVMLEPAITPISHVFYAKFHPEPVDMTEDPLSEGSIDPDRDPYDSNQGIPSLLFGNAARRSVFESRFPEFSIMTTQHLALFAYPLSGGFPPLVADPRLSRGAGYGIGKYHCPDGGAGHGVSVVDGSGTTLARSLALVRQLRRHGVTGRQYRMVNGPGRHWRADRRQSRLPGAGPKRHCSQPIHRRFVARSTGSGMAWMAGWSVGVPAGKGGGA